MKFFTSFTTIFKYNPSPKDKIYAWSITSICIQMHHMILGKISEEEPSFNDCSMTYFEFLCNWVILNSIIIGSTQGCQSMEDMISPYFSPFQIVQENFTTSY